MEDKLNRYLLISLFIHILLLLIFGRMLNKGLVRLLKNPEIELLEISDIAFPVKNMEGAPEDSAFTNEAVKDIKEPFLDRDLIGEDLIPSTDDTLIPVYRDPKVNPSVKEIYEKNTSEFRPVFDDMRLPSLTDDMTEMEKELKKAAESSSDKDYEIISPDLAGRKLLTTGEIPKNLVFSKNERITLNFTVNPEGIVGDIEPETITSGENLATAISILNQFRWEKIEGDKTISAKIIFYFKVK